MVPIIMLAGPAGSGKDHTAAILAKNYGATPIAQADPLKRLLQKVFLFTDEQLWGPSDCRNARDDRFLEEDAWYKASQRFPLDAWMWLKDVFPGQASEVNPKIVQWFEGCKKYYLSQEDRRPTPRYLAQTLGTEFGRSVDPNTWIDYALRVANALLAGGYRYDRTVGLVDDPAASSSFVVITDGRFRNEILGVQKSNGIVVRIDTPEVTEVTGGIEGHRSETELQSTPPSFFTAVIINDRSFGAQSYENMVTQVFGNITQVPVFAIKSNLIVKPGQP